MIRFTVLALAFLFTKMAGFAEEQVQSESFVICYNPGVAVQDLEPYSLVVVDYAYPQASVAKLRRQGKVVFGYLSIAKVHHQRPFASRIKSLGIKYERDPEFPGSLRINAADPKWRELLVADVIPQIKRLGFNGIFLDDLDDLKKRKIEQHGVSLIRDIRQANPGIKLMANRGLEYLAGFAPFVDFVLLESCFVLDGQLRKSSDPAWALELLDAGKSINPKLRGAAVDYIQAAVPQSTSGKQQSFSRSQSHLVKKIRELHARHGLLSLVTTSDLQSVPDF